MAKSMITQKLGNKVLTNYVPANATNAQDFADAMMVGETVVYSAGDVTGSDEVDESFAVSIMIQQDSDSAKTYLNLVIPVTKSETDIHDALSGKTFNDIKADNIVIISMRHQTH